MVADDSFDAKLRGVYALREAAPVLNEFLASIPLDDDDRPVFLFDWQVDVVRAFVAAANTLTSPFDPPVPYWIHTRPGELTVDSFIADFVALVQEVGRGRSCGAIMLVPSTVAEFTNISACWLGSRRIHCCSEPWKWRSQQPSMRTGTSP